MLPRAIVAERKEERKKNSFMTSWLLIFRARKLLLAKQYNFFPTIENIKEKQGTLLFIKNWKMRKPVQKALGNIEGNN